MTDPLPISYLNDFIFCPRSIYFHQLCGDQKKELYHREAQVRGRAVHEAIDHANYSNSTDVLQGVPVYSERYNLFGKIDLFHVREGRLVERKAKIRTVYDGYVFQLYAQAAGLEEAGFTVKRYEFYSYGDNRTWPVKPPSENLELFRRFEETAAKLNSLTGSDPVQINPEKCRNCVYESICDLSPISEQEASL